MEKSKSLKTIAFALSLVLILPMFALLLSACGNEAKPEQVYHTVTYYAEDKQTVLQYVKVEDGKEAVYSAATPKKASTEKYTYEFFAWVDENGQVANLTAVKEDVSVYACFNQWLVEYSLSKPSNVTVTRNGSALRDGETIYYGDSLLISYTASSGSEMTVFKINGVNVSNNTLYTVKGNVEVIYQEKSLSSLYTVNFVDPEGNVIGTQEVARDGYAQNQSYTSSEYTLLSWDFDFATKITQNTEISGYFVKNNEKISGAEIIATGPEVGDSLTINLEEGNPIYSYLESQFGEGNVQNTLSAEISVIDTEVNDWCYKQWGAVSYAFHVEIGDRGFTLGYFANADIISIATDDWGVGASHLYLVKESGEGNLNGTYLLYKNVYGLSYTGIETSVNEEDKYSGVSVVATGYSVGDVMTLSLGSGNPLYDYFARKFGAENVPTSIELTIDDIDSNVGEYERSEWGNIFYSIRIKNETLGISPWVGYYDFGDVITINLRDLGLGLSNVFFVKDVGSGYGELNGTYSLYSYVEGLEEEWATVNYIGLNGDIIATTRNRVGAKMPILHLESDVEGYTIVSLTSDNELVQGGVNNLYALYVKDDEADGVTMTLDSTGRLWIDSTANLDISNSSEMYAYLCDLMGSDIPNSVTFKCAGEYSGDSMPDESYVRLGNIDYRYDVAVVDGETEQSIGYIGTFDYETLIVVNLGDSAADVEGRRYFVPDEFGMNWTGTGYSLYKNIYSYNNFNK